MKFASIALTNFRSFRKKVEFSKLRNVNIFVGPNKAGKSNLFEALSLLRSLAWHEESKRAPASYYFDQRTQEMIIIDIELELSHADRRKVINLLPRHDHLFRKHELQNERAFKSIKYHAELEPTILRGVGPIDITEEELYISDSENNYVKVIHHKIRKGSPRRYCVDLSSALSNFDSIDEFAKVKLRHRGQRTLFRAILAGNAQEIEYQIGDMRKDFLKKIRVYPPWRKADASGGVIEGARLLENGSNLVTAINALNEQKQRELRRELKRIGEVKNMATRPVMNNITVSVHEAGLRSNVDLENMSYGLQQTLILLVLIITAESNETICIEEPELNLHSSFQKKVFDMMSSRNENDSQFFLTTHSSIFTAIGNDVTTHLISKIKGASIATPIEVNSDLKLIKEQLGIRNSDIYGDDYVIFVEGDSEYVSFPIIFQALGYTQIGKKIRLSNLKGQGNIKKLRHFLSYLNEFGTKIFVVMDQNEEIHKKLKDFVREKLLQEDHYMMWPRNLEDLFDSEAIIRAMKRLSQDQKFTFSMTVANLEDQRKRKRKSVVAILKEYMDLENNPDFNKVDLAQQLANMIVHEIHSGKEREQTSIEKHIHEIMKVVLNDLK
jgi:predicted ATPase